MTYCVALNLANMGVFPSLVYKMQKCDLHLNERLGFLAIQKVQMNQNTSSSEIQATVYILYAKILRLYMSFVLYITTILY